jgi:hypothetical protein
MEVAGRLINGVYVGLSMTLTAVQIIYFTKLEVRLNS